MLVFRVFLLLLMEDILHQLVGTLSYYLHVFIHPRWLIRRISEPSTVPLFLGDQKSPPKRANRLALRRVSSAWCSCPCWAPCCPICCWCPFSPGTIFRYRFFWGGNGTEKFTVSKGMFPVYCKCTSTFQEVPIKP